MNQSIVPILLFGFLLSMIVRGISDLRATGFSPTKTLMILQIIRLGSEEFTIHRLEGQACVCTKSKKSVKCPDYTDR